MSAKIALIVSVTALPGVVLAGGAGAAGTAGEPARGAQVFAQTGCGACHTLRAAGATGRIGPNLDTAKPSYERALAIISDGRGGMPRYTGDLTAQQIADVAAYVVQATGGQLPAVSTPAPVTTPAPGEPAPAATTRPGATEGQDAAGVVRVDLEARRLVLTPRRARSGRVTFVVRNRERRAHSLVVLRTERALAALPMRGRRVREIGRMGGIGLPAGMRRRLTLKLEPGRYVVLSNRAGDYRRGLRARLVVVGPAPTTTAPPRAVPPPALTPAPTPTSEPALPPPPLDARRMFVTTCGGCHTLTAAGTSGVAGPNLDREAPSCEESVKVMGSGEDEMPSFRGALTDQQIRDIANYIAQATGRPGCGSSVGADDD